MTRQINTPIQQALIDAAMDDVDEIHNLIGTEGGADAVFKALLRSHKRLVTAQAAMDAERSDEEREKDPDYTSPLHVIASALWANMTGYDESNILAAECDGGAIILAFANLAHALQISSHLEMVVKDYDGGLPDGPHAPINSLLRGGT